MSKASRKMKHSAGKAELQCTKQTRYAGVKYDPATKTITGWTNRGFGDKVDVLFSANPILLAVDLAMEIESSSLMTFMRYADGFGAPGRFPAGYDWSGIRDSTHAAQERMFAAAKQFLFPHKAKLVEKGLPGKLVKAITE